MLYLIVGVGGKLVMKKSDKKVLNLIFGSNINARDATMAIIGRGRRCCIGELDRL